MDVYTRHPHQNMSEFMKYLENSLKNYIRKIKKFTCGDFNIDLLKLETISVYQEYYNLLCSYGFLPHIIQPTRIVENQIPSVIDNIFSNNICEEITAGNIFIMFSEHLSQFISVKKEKLDFKKQNIYVQNYSKFSSESFREDVSQQNFNHRHNSIDDQFNDFFWRLDGCVDRHAPVKKLKPKEVK